MAWVVPKLIAQKYGLTHISTGDLFRQEIASGSDFGKALKEIIDNGDLVPDELLFSTLEKAPLNEKNGFILDGTPRNQFQAEEFEKIIQKVNIYIDKSGGITRGQHTTRATPFCFVTQRKFWFNFFI